MLNRGIGRFGGEKWWGFGFGAGRLGVLFYYSIRMQLPCWGKRRVYDADRIMRPTCVDSRFSDFQIADAGPRGSFKYFYADKLNCKPRRQAANGFSAKNHKIAKRASHTHTLVGGGGAGSVRAHHKYIRESFRDGALETKAAAGCCCVTTCLWQHVTRPVGRSKVDIFIKILPESQGPEREKMQEANSG